MDNLYIYIYILITKSKLPIESGRSDEQLIRIATAAMATRVEKTGRMPPIPVSDTSCLRKYEVPNA